MTSERAQQFIYLLSTILRLAGNSVSSKDAAIMAFFRTAEHFNLQEPTVRDMVTRSCGVCGIASFHNAIGRLYEGDSLTFKPLFPQNSQHLPCRTRRAVPAILQGGKTCSGKFRRYRLLSEKMYKKSKPG